jgi:hypothetical protein
MNHRCLSASLVAAIVATTAFPAYSQQPKSVTIDGLGSIDAVRVTASVEAVDLKNRIVTFKGPRGNVFAVPVDARVKNLPQVKVGDSLEVDYFETTAIALKSGEGMPARTESTAIMKAAPGDKPGVVGLRKVTTVATVLGVNQQNQSFLVRGPLGHLVEVKSRDAQALAGLTGGGLVEVTYVEGAVIAVRPNASK